MAPRLFVCAVHRKNAMQFTLKECEQYVKDQISDALRACLNSPKPIKYNYLGVSIVITSEHLNKAITGYDLLPGWTIE